MPILVAIFVALLAAGGVLLVASVVSTRRDRRESPLTALRAGLTGRDHPDAAVGAAATAEPVDVSLAEFLSVTVEEGDPYLHVDDLAATLHDARAKAVGVLPGRRR
ncbi:hypothetical protein ACPPVS_06515 [Cellulomonas sp. McL0617]|uniref:hypothetical protein n=1 Tax=Cellulomonas sp. McL0617 TaxID=3415675 RepID=UPI003CFB15A1